MERRLVHIYDEIISVENLFAAWQEFVMGKRDKPDVRLFSARLLDNIIALHNELAAHTYRHAGYIAFNISDPKPRNIHKASVRDRLLHHALYRVLYPFFDRTFIADSYSCRLGKGTHKALNRFRAFAYQVSHNHTRTCWVLKCDIRKFFASIDHAVLTGILSKYISDPDIIWLLGQIIGSFYSLKAGVGLPIGNLTSQLLVNVYMNELDQFMKQELKARHYLRYADDFVILSPDKSWLMGLFPAIERFLWDRLKLRLHQDKIFIKTFASGIDFLGWVHFPTHRVLRTATKRRMLKRIRNVSSLARTQSYLGLLKHGNTCSLRRVVEQSSISS